MKNVYRAQLPPFGAHFYKKRPFHNYYDLLSKSKFWQCSQNYWFIFGIIWALSGAFQSTYVCLQSMKRRKYEIHESRRYGIFFSICEIAIKVVITENLAESLFFAFMLSWLRNRRSSVPILSLISLNVVQIFNKNQTCKVRCITL